MWSSGWFSPGPPKINLFGLKRAFLFVVEWRQNVHLYTYYSITCSMITLHTFCIITHQIFLLMSNENRSFELNKVICPVQWIKNYSGSVSVRLLLNIT